MFRTIDYDKLDGNFILIDVRSPREFDEATIPGAVNLPIFDNEERAEIGYVYVNESVEKAKKLGVAAVSRKLPYLYEKIADYDKEYDRLVFFCARGGMRSSSLCSLTSSLGVNSYKLSGGYKGYRSFINKELPSVNSEVKYIVLHGKTGVGKTKILEALKNKGRDVLDLEDAANHRGSLLGNVGIGQPRSQKAFESLVYENLKNRNSNFVFIEGESKRVGDIIIPQYIYKKMEEGIHIFIDADIKYRGELILEEYIKDDSCIEDILNSLRKMEKYISKKNIDRYVSMVQNGEFQEVAEELMIKYYDPMYMNGINKYSYEKEFLSENVVKCTEEIDAWFIDNIKFKA